MIADSTILQPYLLGVVRELQILRQEAHKFPDDVLLNEIMKVVNEDMKEGLQALVDDKVLLERRNINQIPMYRIANKT